MDHRMETGDNRRPAPSEPALSEPAPSRAWVQAHDRRVRAASIGLRLQPAAIALGGYASARLRVCVPGQHERRPAAALVPGEPPVDGIATRAPLLVVELAPADPARWLALGVCEVWVAGDDALVVHRAGGPAEALGVGDEVAVPRIGLRLPVAGLLRGTRHA